MQQPRYLVISQGRAGGVVGGEGGGAGQGEMQVRGQEPGCGGWQMAGDPGTGGAGGMVSRL